MIERLRTRKQQLLDHQRILSNLKNLSNSSNEENTSLKRLSTNSKLTKRNRLAKLVFPTRSRIKLHQSQLSTSSPLNEQVARLNQRTVDVQTGIERSISSLQTQRLQHLTALNEKTRDLEKAAAAFEYSSSQHLKQELDKTRQLSYIFRIAIVICLTLFSVLIGYMTIQLIRDKGAI